jgi:hypothetical protein
MHTHARARARARTHTHTQSHPRTRTLTHSRAHTQARTHSHARTHTHTSVCARAHATGAARVGVSLIAMPINSPRARLPWVAGSGWSTRTRTHAVPLFSSTYTLIYDYSYPYFRLVMSSFPIFSTLIRTIQTHADAVGRCDQADVRPRDVQLRHRCPQPSPHPEHSIPTLGTISLPWALYPYPGHSIPSLSTLSLP